CRAPPSVAEAGEDRHAFARRAPLRLRSLVCGRISVGSDGSPGGARMRSMGWLLLVGVAVSLAALGDASAQGPIKIGFLSPLSGAIAAAGKDMYSGCELFWQESGWQMAGRKVEVVLEDNEGNPATTLTKARKLVESDKVHLLMGVILSNVAYALVPYVEQQGIPTMYPINPADDLTQRRRPKWLIRTGFSAGGNMHPFGEYAAKTLGYKRIV